MLTFSFQIVLLNFSLPLSYLHHISFHPVFLAVMLLFIICSLSHGTSVTLVPDIIKTLYNKIHDFPSHRERELDSSIRTNDIFNFVSNLISRFLGRRNESEIYFGIAIFFTCKSRMFSSPFCLYIPC